MLITEDMKIEAAKRVFKNGTLNKEQIISEINRNILEGKVSTEKGEELKLELFPSEEI
jgi:hypothetical protein